MAVLSLRVEIAVSQRGLVYTVTLSYRAISEFSPSVQEYVNRVASCEEAHGCLRINLLRKNRTNDGVLAKETWCLDCICD